MTTLRDLKKKLAKDNCSNRNEISLNLLNNLQDQTREGHTWVRHGEPLACGRLSESGRGSGWMVTDLHEHRISLEVQAVYKFLVFIGLLEKYLENTGFIHKLQNANLLLHIT